MVRPQHNGLPCAKLKLEVSRRTRTRHQRQNQKNKKPGTRNKQTWSVQCTVQWSFTDTKALYSLTWKELDIKNLNRKIAVWSSGRCTKQNVSFFSCPKLPQWLTHWVSWCRKKWRNKRSHTTKLCCDTHFHPNLCRKIRGGKILVCDIQTPGKQTFFA